MRFLNPRLLVFSLTLFFLSASSSLFAQCSNPFVTYPVSFDFETNNGGWITGGTNNDWAWGHPSKPVISSAGGGQNCWVTGGLSASNYNDGERSWLQSPKCFDFSGLQYPYVEFKVFWETEKQFDGASFQYSTNNGADWFNVGAIGDNSNCMNRNWFNFSPVKYLSSLSGTQDGWSGNIQSTLNACLGGDGSNGWVTSRHTLYNLAGQSHVLFRFVFGSGSTCNDFDGFAVDDIVFSNNAPGPVITYTNISNATCNGTPTGSAVAGANYGMLPYSYDWTNGNDTYSGPSVHYLPAGNYRLTVTDNNNCSDTRDFVVTEPPALSHTTDTTGTTCGLSNGAASITESGGAAPYTYSWTPNVSAASAATGLAAGNYNVVVKDKNNCPETIDINIVNTGFVTADISSSANVTCFGGNNGSAIVSTKETGTFSYQWSPSGGNAATANNLAAGNYSVVVTDFAGCTDTVKVQLTQPGEINTSITTYDVTCNGNNGKAAIKISGGAGGYTYLWMPGNFNSDSVSNLAPGTYTVTVTDAGGCSKSDQVVINALPAPVITGISLADATCNGLNNGSATAAANSGVMPYDYKWTSGSDAYSGSDVQNLSPGNYLLKVTDANGCSADSVITIHEPQPLLHTTTSTSITCTNTTGSATVNETGGTAPYAYSWSPSGGNSATASGLAAGDYIAYITDAHQCTDNAHVQVTTTSAVTAAIGNVATVSCNGGSNGSITSTASGAGPFSYSWSPAGGTAAEAGNLAAGIYTVTIKDPMGCVATATAEVTEPAPLASQVTAINTTCGNNNGSAQATLTGGTGSYTYSWMPGNYTDAAISNLAPATYTLTVTDINACTKTDQVIIQSSSALQPPVMSHTDVLCYGMQNGSATAVMQNGSAPFAYSWSGSNSSSKDNSLQSVGAGTYHLNVTDAYGCFATANVTIMQPEALNHTVNITFATCSNSNGSAAVEETGGTAPYIYAWSPTGGSNASATGLAPGDYVVSITDDHQCADSVHLSVVNIGGVTVTVNNAQNVSCFGAGDGSAAVSVAGSAPPFTYAWSPSGGTSSAAANLVAGNYTATVTDRQGCVGLVAVQVEQPPVLQTAFSVGNTTCNSSNGTAVVLPSGGAAPYTYLWSSVSEATDSISNLSAGRYVVLITDANGCQKTDSAVIASSGKPAITAINRTDVTCKGQQTGSATATVSGGIAPYNFTWTNGAQSMTSTKLENIAAGTYRLVVADVSGCTDTAQTIIAEPEALQVNVIAAATTCGMANGSARAEVSGGLPPYQYAWSSGGNGNQLQRIAQGTYKLTVTDANACTVTGTQVKVDASSALHISLGRDTTICPRGEVVLNPGAFAAYAWQDNTTMPVYHAVVTGRYFVTATDSIGCKASASVKVTVHCDDIVFPTAFTPNGDHLNDAFGPLGTLSAVSSYSFRIFNRWGQPVFISNNPYQKWEGMVNGSDPGSGTFIWIADYSFNGQPKKIQKGTIVLIK